MAASLAVNMWPRLLLIDQVNPGLSSNASFKAVELLNQLWINKTRSVCLSSSVQTLWTPKVGLYGR